MLVLTRKENQSIMVGDSIEIVVTKIDSDRVKIGINAPGSVSIHRQEVYEDIKRENIAAARIGIALLQQASEVLMKKKDS